MAEYEPQKPKLTKRERAFCELFKTGWITRDAFSDLEWYELKLYKIKSCWELGEGDCFDMMFIPYINEMFKFITWEDEEPWAVEDLLKLEVIEND